MMYCSECGKEMPNDCMFCPNCGAKQEENQTQQTTANQLETGMVSCVNCGKPIPADSKFCPECRAPQSDTPLMRQQSRVMRVQSAYVNRQQPSGEEGKIKKRNKIIGIIVGIALGLCVIIIALSFIIKPSINLNKYVTISFEGYDTVGDVVVSFDTEKFDADYGKKLSSITGKKNTSGISEYVSDKEKPIFDYYDISSGTAKFLSDCVNGELDESFGLSNGDVVEYTWDCDDEKALSMYGFKLKYEDIKMTVEDLEEAETFDPFEGIEVVFEGIGPDGSAYIDGEPVAEAAQDLGYELDYNTGLSNGDSVTVTVSLYYDDPVEYCIQNYGMIPSPLTKTYTVDGLDSYIKSASDISEDSLDDMQAQAEDVYNAYIAKNWEDGEALQSFTYIGNYLLTSKKSDDWGDNNILYLVYKAQVKNTCSDDDGTYNKTNDIYWYICYYNLLVNTEGVITVDITHYTTPRDRFTIDSGIHSGWWGTKSWEYYGYQTLDELYKTVVISNSELYKHEDNIDESISPIVEEDIEEKIISKEGEEGIIFPNSSNEEITVEEIKELSDEELRYAINELYARHGYSFKDEGLKEFYERYEWYEAIVEPDDFLIDMFNDIEKKNIEALQKERDSRN